MDRRDFLKDAVILAGGLLVSGPLAACAKAQGMKSNAKSGTNMKILIIESSPHKQGSSNMLADNFARGAREAGHTVDVFDAGHASIHPCLGCDACGMAGPCVQKDDYELKLKPMIKNHDLIVLATPLYYYGFSAQMKMVIDRFYSFTYELTDMHKKTILICAAWNSDSDTFPYIKSHYDKLCRYMQFSDQGTILGTGCGTPSMTQRSEWPRKAYELGKSI